MHDKACPLCGSEFDSLDVLRGRIQQQRSSVSRDGEITFQYKTLLANEARAADSLRVATGAVSTANGTIDELRHLLEAAEQRLGAFRTRLAASLIEYSEADALQAVLFGRRADLEKESQGLGEVAEVASRALEMAKASHAQETAKRVAVNERISALERRIKELSDRMEESEARSSQILPTHLTAGPNLAVELAQADRSISEVAASIEQLQIAGRSERDSSERLRIRRQSLSDQRGQIVSKLSEIDQAIAAFRQRLRRLDLPDNVDPGTLDRTVQQENSRAGAVREVLERGRVILAALAARETRLQLIERRAQLDQLGTRLDKLGGQVRHLDNAVSVFASIEKLLTRERESAIQRHIAAYGPMITTIQQRLRSVYGFGGVHLEAHSGQATVHVEWRNKSVQVPPTDFFSDSQRQILMLSIFLAGGLRQNWSGFAPMLLDDPVTHFDDLNAYAFVELVRGIISTSPNEWQFIISTCESRLFALMQKKFSRLPSGAVFYEFVGMSEKGPIVERR